MARNKGAERKVALERLIDAGRLDEIPAILLQSAPSEAERQAIGGLPTVFMGGDFSL